MKEIFRRKLNTMLLTVAALALACGNAYAGWTLTDLSAQGAMNSSYAIGINNNGDVVGKASFAGVTYEHAALWRGGTAYNLGDLGGNGSSASRINDSGVVVGEAGTIGQGSQAFKWDSGNGMQALPTLGGPRSSVSAINNSGLMVGMAFNSMELTRPVLWDGDGIHEFGVLSSLYGGNAQGINNSGQIVGMLSDASNKHYAMLWSNGVAQNLGTFGGAGGSSARDINDAGQVLINTLNYNDKGSYWNSAIWSNGSLQILPNMGEKGTSGAAINSSGWVVGSSAIDNNGTSHAVLWQNGAIIDLNTLIDPASGWTLNYAFDINDKGQIVGVGKNSNSAYAAFLLTPDAVAAPVPIPPAFFLFGSGLSGLFFIKRKKAVS